MEKLRQLRVEVVLFCSVTWRPVTTLRNHVGDIKREGKSHVPMVFVSFFFGASKKYSQKTCGSFFFLDFGNGCILSKLNQKHADCHFGSFPLDHWTLASLQALRSSRARRQGAFRATTCWRTTGHAFGAWTPRPCDRNP